MVTLKDRKEGMVTQKMKMEKKMKTSINIREKDGSYAL
jgi:hypothetical protein